MGRRDRIGGVMSSIPGEKRELPPVTWGVMNTIMKSSVILWLY